MDRPFRFRLGRLIRFPFVEESVQCAGPIINFYLGSCIQYLADE